jgi:pimeloyl-ACP methyl ester carboxylesterase
MRSSKYLLKYISFAILIFYFGLLLGIYMNQQSLLYKPTKEIADFETFNLSDTEELFLVSQDGTKLQAWFHKPQGNMPMVIFFHGNSVNLGQENRLAKFNALSKMGYGYIAVSYRGFGNSEGAPSKDGILNDARAAMDFAISKGYEANSLILIGESLGSGVATAMAVEYDVKGMLLITPYTSIADRAQEIYWYLPVRYLVKDNFSNHDLVAHVKCPVIIVHGDNDETIPHSHSHKLIDIITSEKKLIIYPGKGHTDYDSVEVFNEMTDFFHLRQ